MRLAAHSHEELPSSAVSLHSILNMYLLCVLHVKRSLPLHVQRSLIKCGYIDGMNSHIMGRERPRRKLIV